MSGVPQFLDVTVRLRARMPFYPGNPEFELQPIKRIAEGGSSNVSRLVLGTHTGTHVDAPRYFIDDGAATEQLPSEALSTSETVKGDQGCTTTHS
jgi:arylformamidase